MIQVESVPCEVMQGVFLCVLMSSLAGCHIEMTENT